MVGNLAAASYPGVVAALLLTGAWSAYVDVKDRVAAGWPPSRRRGPTVAGASFTILGGYYVWLVAMCVIGRG